MLSELLEVVDNLDRAIEAARRSPSAEALLQGVEMVRRQFLTKLEGLGVKPIDVDRRAVSIRLLHEAITTVPATSPDRTAWSSASSVRAIGSATTCCGRRLSRWPRARALPAVSFMQISVQFMRHAQSRPPGPQPTDDCGDDAVRGAPAPTNPELDSRFASFNPS